MKITVKRVSGKDPRLFIREVNGNIHFELQQRLLELGELTSIRMGDIIRNAIKREGTKGELENSIKSEPNVKVGGIFVGIGKIEDMPRYWEVINSGGYVPPANIGTFSSGSPDSGKSGEQWFHTGGKETAYGFEKLYYINPRQPIEPVRYVEISAGELEIAIDSAVKEFSKAVDQASR